MLVIVFYQFLLLYDAWLALLHENQIACVVWELFDCVCVQEMGAVEKAARNDVLTLF